MQPNQSFDGLCDPPFDESLLHRAIITSFPLDVAVDVPTSSVGDDNVIRSRRKKGGKNCRNRQLRRRC